MTSTIGTREHTPAGLAAGSVVPLDSVTRADVAQVGHKAANLGELRQAGLPVPDGVVLTTRALASVLDSFVSGQPEAEAVKQVGLSEPLTSPAEALEQVRLPEPLARELFQAVARFGDRPLAVRSSSVAEDLPDRSYAGQYESVLDVQGEEALVRAVMTCWRSAWSVRATSYHGAADRPADMAVLIQPMLPAESAGVAFSANPVTGARDQVVINAVRGLGERLVSGAASPDQWLVSVDQAIAQATPERAIDADQARAICRLARAVEAHFGCPQDIEWALAGGELNLLQARPITALPPVAVDPPAGYWEREASHSPRPFSPMCGPLQVLTVNAGFRAMFEEFGFLLETLEVREIGGWMYLRMVPIVDQHLLASRAERCVQAIRSQHHRELLARWEHQWRPQLAARLAGLWELDRPSLSDSAVDGHFGAAIDLFKEAIRIHFVLQGAIVLALGELAATCRELLGWDDAATLELVSGLSTSSTRPAVRLWELAQLARRRPGQTADFSAAMKTFQDEFGKRALSLEFADPSLGEDPALLLRLIRDQLRTGNDPSVSARTLASRRTAALASARARLRTLPLSAQERFERVLAVAQQAYPLREDNEPYTISGPTGLVRAAALEVGQRLARRGQLEARDDVFFLEADDARAALSDGRDRRSLVIARRAERAWIEAHPGPASYGTPPGPPPSVDDLPFEIQQAMQALQWHAGHVFGFGASPGQAASPTATLRGIPASPGTYTGPARVVLSEADFGKIQPGDVLVCPATSPVWSVVFPQLGALVTDSGGLLSHPAIIAREYGIPAVVATGHATSLVGDGDQLTVDGTAGVVHTTPREV